MLEMNWDDPDIRLAAQVLLVMLLTGCILGSLGTFVVSWVVRWISSWAKRVA